MASSQKMYLEFNSIYTTNPKAPRLVLSRWRQTWNGSLIFKRRSEPRAEHKQRQSYITDQTSCARALFYLNNYFFIQHFIFISILFLIEYLDFLNELLLFLNDITCLSLDGIKLMIHNFKHAFQCFDSLFFSHILKFTFII